RPHRGGSPERSGSCRSWFTGIGERRRFRPLAGPNESSSGGRSLSCAWRLFCICQRNRAEDGGVDLYLRPLLDLLGELLEPFLLFLFFLLLLFILLLGNDANGGGSFLARIHRAGRDHMEGAGRRRRRVEARRGHASAAGLLDAPIHRRVVGAGNGG